MDGQENRVRAACARAQHMCPDRPLLPFAEFRVESETDPETGLAKPSYTYLQLSADPTPLCRLIPLRTQTPRPSL
jgi:hypothetical protein